MPSAFAPPHLARAIVVTTRSVSPCRLWCTEGPGWGFNISCNQRMLTSRQSTGREPRPGGRKMGPSGRWRLGRQASGGAPEPPNSTKSQPRSHRGWDPPAHAPCSHSRWRRLHVRPRARARCPRPLRSRFPNAQGTSHSLILR